MENFKVLPSIDQFRVAAHPYRLNYHPATVFRKSDITINANEHNFISMKDISDHTSINIEFLGLIISLVLLKYTFCLKHLCLFQSKFYPPIFTDMIGFLVTFGQLTTQARDNESTKRLNFIVVDLKLLYFTNST